MFQDSISAMFWIIVAAEFSIAFGVSTLLAYSGRKS